LTTCMAGAGRPTRFALDGVGDVRLSLALFGLAKPIMRRFGDIEIGLWANATARSRIGVSQAIDLIVGVQVR
jgi:hypothetical protein